MIVIQNETRSRQRLPVAEEDQKEFGKYLEFASKSEGAAGRAVFTLEALNRMRLQCPVTHDWFVRNRFTFK